ncbi:MAG: (2Fe-2S)-binding protein [Rhodobacteraceae bacterium]|nr:(2Fe-2S)-binding protein [Paracoccaceae bacterium]MCY4196531.1 (2Fe-2S)-binding protein [Paracoccaceae bacterium]MCY4328282.1 (2Fe-2S)-binding protein [Paracoccaceae bacterium]
MSNQLTVNGQVHDIHMHGDTPLLWVLRDGLKLTGTKYGCGVAACGACTVHVDGEPMRSCQVRVADVEGAEVTTIEGVESEVATAVRQAWDEISVVQCGFCQSGQIMSAIGLLTENRQPTIDEIESYMWGNACRCATYQRVRAAVRRASDILEA